MIFVRDTCAIFEHAILKMEGNAVSGYEAAKIVENLRSKLQSQIDANLQRWNDFFKRTEKEDVKSLAKMVSYILTIPGTKYICV